MTSFHLSLATTIIMMVPMLYFFLVSPTFLLVKLDDPVVTWLLRSLISFQFKLVILLTTIGAIAFIIAGRPLIALATAAIPAIAFPARRWFLRRMDTEMTSRDSGDRAALRRLRRLHYGGMAYNATQLIAVVASIPFVFPTAL